MNGEDRLKLRCLDIDYLIVNEETIRLDKPKGKYQSTEVLPGVILSIIIYFIINDMLFAWQVVNDLYLDYAIFLM